MTVSRWLVGSAVVLTAAAIASCDSSRAAGPRSVDALQYAQQFEHLADSLDSALNAGGGFPDASAEAMRHIAEVLRLTGTATPVTVTIDGQPNSFLAVSEEFVFPVIACPVAAAPPPSTPLPDTACFPEGSYTMRAVTAWDPDSLRRIVRMVADTGDASANLGVPDVMAGLPRATASSTPGDSTAVPPPLPPFFLGEYFERGHGIWWASSGSESNTLVARGGSCLRDTTVIDDASFQCRLATVRFVFDMTVQHAIVDPPGSRTHASVVDTTFVNTHTISLPSSDVAGVQLLFLQWTPPPPPPPPDSDSVIAVPRDSTLSASLVAFADSTTGSAQFHFVVTNSTANPIDIQFPTGQTYDVSVYDDSTGAFVWSSSTGVFWTQLARTVTIAPGESWHYDTSWPHPQSGHYRAIGRLTSTNVDAVASSRFGVP